jgi:hypothetical protein
MIQFFINNIELVLPDDFETTIIEENPLITRNGEFSLDITSSLLEPKNNRAFMHINRLNVLGVKTNGDCIMVRNGVTIYGKFIVLESTNTDVVWQFVSGNSYLNYMARNDTKIWELDFGSESPIDFARAMASINNNKGYSNANKFVCAPIKAGDTILNKFSFNSTFETTINIVSVDDIVMQPFLMTYIENLPELIGYKLTDNVLRSDQRANYMYLLNTVQSLNYSDALPDIRILDFINSIERFFNVCFLLDPKTKSLSIIKSNDYLKNMPTVKLVDVLDNHKIEFSDFESSGNVNEYNTSFLCSEISYSNLGGDLFYKYHQLSDSVLSKMQIIEFETLTHINLHIGGGVEKKSLPIIYVDKETGNHYLYEEPTNRFMFAAFSGARLIRINKFRNAIINTDLESKLEIELTPASLTTMQVYYRFIMQMTSENVNTVRYFDMPIPVATVDNFVDSSQTAKSLVEDGVNQLPRANSLISAFYYGRVDIGQNYFHTYLYWTPAALYPHSFLDFYAETYYLQALNSLSYVNYGNCTFRLYGENSISELYYNDPISFEEGAIYKFLFENRPQYSVLCKFEHNGYYYIPIHFSKNVSKDSKTVEGYFYRLKS